MSSQKRRHWKAEEKLRGVLQMSANVAICGLVRTPDLLLESISDFMVLRKQNLLDQIVFSTWIGEIDQYQGLRQRLTQCGVKLLESSPPEISGPGHIWHQMKALDLGLGQLADESYVLKTRADLYIRPEFIKMLATSEEYLQIADDGHKPIFEKKIWIPWFEISKPFYMADECFFGLCKDLKKLVNYDASYHVLYDIDCGISHVRRFIHPFLRDHSIFYEYLQFGVQTGHSSMKRFAILDFDLHSDIFLEYLATYYLILDRYFRVETGYVPHQIRFREHSDPTVTIDSDQFDQNFTREKSWNSRGGHIYAYDERWLRNLLSEDITRGKLVKKFHDALSRSRSGQFSLDSVGRRKLVRQYEEQKDIMLSQIPKLEQPSQSVSIRQCLKGAIRRAIESSKTFRAVYRMLGRFYEREQ